MILNQAYFPNDQSSVCGCWSAVSFSWRLSVGDVSLCPPVPVPLCSRCSWESSLSSHCSLSLLHQLKPSAADTLSEAPAAFDSAEIAKVSETQGYRKSLSRCRNTLRVYTCDLCTHTMPAALQPSITSSAYCEVSGAFHVFTPLS